MDDRQSDVSIKSAIERVMSEDKIIGGERSGGMHTLTDRQNRCVEREG